MEPFVERRYRKRMNGGMQKDKMKKDDMKK
jgi:hypothetical protein